MAVESGRVIYTRWGYCCGKCGYGFKWELTSPVSKCPRCGDIINDRMAYYICRAGRAFGSAFTLAWLLFVLELMYSPKTFPLLSIIPLAALTGILYYKQIWSLVLIRIIYRAFLIVAIMLLIMVILGWALNALNILKYDGIVTVAAALAISLVLTVASLIAFKINGKTFDYREASGVLDPP